MFEKNQAKIEIWDGPRTGRSTNKPVVRYRGPALRALHKFVQHLCVWQIITKEDMKELMEKAEQWWDG